MSSLLGMLPPPTRDYGSTSDAADERPSSSSAPPPSKSLSVPPYGQRKGFVPRRVQDFGDGGAFPEIHVAQYPLDMGRPDQKGKSTKTLALTTNAEGDVNYDAVLKQGRNANKWIASEHGALVPKIDKIKGDFERPDEEEEAETAKETRAALEAVVAKKIGAQQPKNVPSQPGAPTYIKYTPSQAGPAYNSGAGSRIIKMQDMPVDPMEPPKFRHKKVPRGSGDPPVPVMHSPPRQVTAADQADWKIPPCVSSWKNAKGYTIPLDKRLAADGRGLQEVQINDKFASLTEGLYVAEQKAREAVEMRSKLQRELMAKEKARKEAELRDLAMRARLDRVGGGVGAAAGAAAPSMAAQRAEPVGGGMGGGRGHYDDDEYDDERAARRGGDAREQSLPGPPGLPGPPPRRGDDDEREHGHEGESREEREARRAREEIREERRRERERERRLEAKGAHGARQSKLTRDRDRDISEKVALGLANAKTGEVMYDARLFNQDAGMDSGLASEDAYNLYDKPLFAERSGIYRTGKTLGGDHDDDAGGAGGAGGEGGAAIRTDKFKPDRGFSGVDYGAGGEGGGRGGGAVQFEKEAPEADPFGLDQFLTDVKEGGGGKDGGKDGTGGGSGRKRKALDGIGGGGAMGAGGGGGGTYEDYAGGSSRSRVDFQSGSGRR